MDEIRINVPEGMEIDKENSTFECIKIKPKNPMSDFKKGDFLYVLSTIGYEYYCIFDKINGKTVVGLHNCGSDGRPIDNSNLITIGDIKEVRFMTPDEQRVFLINLTSHGYVWGTERLEVRKKPALPKTWEEYCKNYLIKEGEHYIDILAGGKGIKVRLTEDDRDEVLDRGTLPNKETAEAFIALMQLVQLRDCYNDGWKPDWENERETKYCVNHSSGQVLVYKYTVTSNVLAFKTKELCDQFIENFRDLIEIAKPLI